MKDIEFEKWLPETEGDELFAQGIALACLGGVITLDVVSPKNNLTSLDQIIMFELDLEDADELERIERMVLARIYDFRGGMDFFAYDRGTVKNFWGVEEKILEKGITEEELEVVDDSICKDIARACINGNLSDDNPSPSNGLTALEQLIRFDFGVETSSEIDHYKEIVIKWIGIFNTGSYNNIDDLDLYPQIFP